MNRPRHIWGIFAACALVLVGAVTWVTAMALRLERAQSEAQRAAEYEEKVRLALWRMDSLLTPIIVEESARPATHYAQLPASSLSKQVTAKATPSPLWFQTPEHAQLYFQLGPDGAVTSPNILPPGSSEFPGAKLVGESRNALATSSGRVNVNSRFEELKRLLTQPAAATDQTLSFDNGTLLSNVASASVTNLPVLNFTNLVAGNQQPEQAPMQQIFNATPAEIREQNRQVQVVRNSSEFQARANVYQQVAQAGVNAFANQSAPSAQPAMLSVARSEGPMTPVWIGSALILVRRANTESGSVVHGVWLNWDSLKQTLRENVRDLFPSAEWRAATGTNGFGERRLAALPVDFVPGAIDLDHSVTGTSSRLTLALAWGCMLVAVAAVALLLHGAVALSERRGAFVSAVTHELRTPLTTFKMYSEMLADGMVPDEAKRRQYLSTLCAEANRLSHLVENVLAYARLERGSARRRVECVTLGALIERTLPRLRERAERAEMQLVVDADDRALTTTVHVDAGAVEQILFNLVDNACKYAAPTASEKVIHLEALPEGRFAMLRVRDHGAGISAEGARRLFQPFSKSAQEAAHSAPGIGLGLALCRRLSRSLGGELRLVNPAGQGACFELRLPLGVGGAGAALSSI